jgi:hypothetical protein
MNSPRPLQPPRRCSIYGTSHISDYILALIACATRQEPSKLDRKKRNRKRVRAGTTARDSLRRRELRVPNPGHGMWIGSEWRVRTGVSECVWLKRTGLRLARRAVDSSTVICVGCCRA